MIKIDNYAQEEGRKNDMTNVRNFLKDIADNEILKSRKYSIRIEIDDGGDNSYIGLTVDTEDFHRKTPVTRNVKVFRHSNSVNKLENTWGFDLGNVCHAYADNPNIPLLFETYGKTPDEAEAEAVGYFKELKKMIRKQTSDYKIEAAKTAQEEREKLIARLNELGDGEELPS